eukprot:12131354-Heterocapsa_arctica.AAC.2
MSAEPLAAPNSCPRESATQVLRSLRAKWLPEKPLLGAPGSSALRISPYRYGRFFAVGFLKLAPPVGWVGGCRWDPRGVLGVRAGRRPGCGLSVPAADAGEDVLHAVRRRGPAWDEPVGGYPGHEAPVDGREGGWVGRRRGDFAAPIEPSIDGAGDAGE